VQYSESLAGIPNGMPADVENKKALINQGFNGVVGVAKMAESLVFQ